MKQTLRNTGRPRALSPFKSKLPNFAAVVLCIVVVIVTSTQWIVYEAAAGSKQGPNHQAGPALGQRRWADNEEGVGSTHSLCGNQSLSQLDSLIPSDMIYFLKRWKANKLDWTLAVAWLKQQVRGREGNSFLCWHM
jgi:hypothetical protein